MCAKDCWNALEGAERPRSRKQELRQQRTPSSEGGLRPDARQSAERAAPAANAFVRRRFAARCALRAQKGLRQQPDAQKV